MPGKDAKYYARVDQRDIEAARLQQDPSPIAIIFEFESSCLIASQ